MHKRKKCLCQDHKIDTLIRQCALYHYTKHLAHTYVWKWVVSNHGGTTEATRVCGTVSHVFSGLISVFVFDILGIHSECIQICCGLIAPPGCGPALVPVSYKKCKSIYFHTPVFRQVSALRTDVYTYITYRLLSPSPLYGPLSSGCLGN
jgi:hypothetical protein